MRSSLRNLAKVPVLGRVVMGAFRMKAASPHVLRSAGEVGRWLIRSREYTNFTYDLTELNRAYLASFVAAATGAQRRDAMGYIHELDADEKLRAHIDAAIHSSSERYFADGDARYGRRLGWYAFARITKPRVVVETGVDKGLGACVLAAALLRNRAEGHEGIYYGTDIQPRAGYLFQGRYAEAGRILYGDSIKSLEQIDETIDLFINDSDHSAAYEAREYETIKSKLADGALIIGDNAHVTRELLDFAEATGREFLFFKEQPQQHWYPGAGIGVAYRHH